MKTKIIVILFLLMLTNAGFALSEDQVADTNILPAAPSVAPAAPQESNESPNTQWVWGEVTSVDAQNKALTLKYLDYETDQEKEMVINTDDLTSYDNAKSLGEIQLKDNISVDYIVKDGKNIAKTIGLEKAENTPVAVTNPQAGETNSIDAGAANLPAAASASVETPKTDAQSPQANQ